MPKIKQLRKSQNLNAMELAQKAGLDLNQPLMSAMESGKVLPTPHDLQAVCEALQCTPLDLFDSVEEFDLMAVQRRMEHPQSKETTDEQKHEMTLQAFSRFGSLPPPNPKRQFRMADEEYDALMDFVKWSGYRTLSNYLRNISKSQKVIRELFKEA